MPYTNSTVITGAGQRLGSTSLTTDENGAVVAEQRYYPYGQVRWSDGTLPTDHQFTGQKREASLGLYDYYARFYDPYIHCFISADTIVPNPGNPQDLNRYSYVRNSPLNYRDPSGHAAAVDQEGTVTVRSLGYAGMFMLLEHPAVTASAVDCIRQDIAVELGHALSSPKLGRDPAMSVATMSSRASSASAAGRLHCVLDAVQDRGCCGGHPHRDGEGPGRQEELGRSPTQAELWQQEGLP